MQCGNLYIVDGEWEGVSLQQKQPVSALEVETAWKPFTDGVCSDGGSREEGHKYKQEERTDNRGFRWTDRHTVTVAKSKNSDVSFIVLSYILAFCFYFLSGPIKPITPEMAVN